jgi:hypothetical protein
VAFDRPTMATLIFTTRSNHPAHRRTFATQREGVVNFDQQAADRCAMIADHRSEFGHCR